MTQRLHWLLFVTALTTPACGSSQHGGGSGGGDGGGATTLATSSTSSTGGGGSGGGAPAAVVATIAIPDFGDAAAFDPATKRLWVATGSPTQPSQAVAIDTTSDTVVANVALPDGARHVVVDTQSGKVLFGSPFGGVVVVDGKTGAVDKTISLAVFIGDLAVDSAAGRIYLATQTTELGSTMDVTVVDEASGTVAQTIPLPPGNGATLLPMRAGIDVAAHTFYVATESEDSMTSKSSVRVDVVDTGASTVTATLPFPGLPEDLGVGAHAWFIAENDPAVHVLGGADVALPIADVADSLGPVGTKGVYVFCRVYLDQLFQYGMIDAAGTLVMGQALDLSGDRVVVGVPTDLEGNVYALTAHISGGADAEVLHLKLAALP